jgi:hypothetical protein
VPQLLGYETGYSRKIYRFADYNAGRYASRNAALQQALAALSGTDLALDGDLLSYGKADEVLSTVTSSEKAARVVNAKLSLGLSDGQIRADFSREKSGDFVSTRTFTALRDAFARKTGKPPAFAIVPVIRLSSPKIRRSMTTRLFAESVEKRYQSCMAAK